MATTNGHGPKRAVLYARVSTEAQAADDKTSLSEQLLALRKYADAHGYKVVEEIAEEVSGRKQDTEGLEKLRGLAESGEIDAVLVYKWNRLARTVARFETFILEMKLAGVEVLSLDGQSNETASGRMFNRLMAVFSEYQRDDLVETMQQGKRGAARSGKVVPGRFAPYGFTYNRNTRNYDVDEGRMVHTRRIFRMMGAEGRGIWTVKRAFDAEGVPTTTGRRYWDPTTIKDIVFNDVYRLHSSEELKALIEDGNLSPDVYAGLDPERAYGIQWYNRHKTVPGPGGRNKNIQVGRPRSEWVAVPVPDAGIPLDWVEEARKSIRSNVRHSDAGRRAWPLKGFAYCPCGARLVPHTLVKGGKDQPRFYYVCRWHRARKGGCEYAKYYKAEEIEGRVSAFVLDLIRNPTLYASRLRPRLPAKRRPSATLASK
jgi:site-specific DNA recombinase